MADISVKLHQTRIPIYTTSGDFSAIMMYPYLFDRQGEWIGWARKDKTIFNVEGLYVGWLTDGPRIIRKRVNGAEHLPGQLPPIPGRIQPIAHAPLPPMMSELPFNLIDVFDEMPELLHTVDSGMRMKDME